MKDKVEEEKSADGVVVDEILIQGFGSAPLSFRKADHAGSTTTNKPEI